MQLLVNGPCAAADDDSIHSSIARTMAAGENKDNVQEEERRRQES